MLKVSSLVSAIEGVLGSLQFANNIINDWRNKLINVLVPNAHLFASSNRSANENNLGYFRERYPRIYNRISASWTYLKFVSDIVVGKTPSRIYSLILFEILFLHEELASAPFVIAGAGMASAVIIGLAFDTYRNNRNEAMQQHLELLHSVANHYLDHEALLAKISFGEVREALAIPRSSFAEATTPAYEKTILKGIGEGILFNFIEPCWSTACLFFVPGVATPLNIGMAVTGLSLNLVGEASASYHINCTLKQTLSRERRTFELQFGCSDIKYLESKLLQLERRNVRIIEYLDKRESGLHPVVAMRQSGILEAISDFRSHPIRPVVYNRNSQGIVVFAWSMIRTLLAEMSYKRSNGIISAMANFENRGEGVVAERFDNIRVELPVCLVSPQLQRRVVEIERSSYMTQDVLEVSEHEDIMIASGGEDDGAGVGLQEVVVTDDSLVLQQVREERYEVIDTSGIDGHKVQEPPPPQITRISRTEAAGSSYRCNIM